MKTNEMWDSAIRSAGDLAGVFEYDGDVGYFYLYNETGQADQKIRGAIHIISGTPNFGQGDISVRWTPDENTVGLFIRGQLWAAFDSKTGVNYGGHYRAGTSPIIPPTIAQMFKNE